MSAQFDSILNKVVDDTLEEIGDLEISSHENAYLLYTEEFGLEANLNNAQRVLGNYLYYEMPLDNLIAWLEQEGFDADRLKPFATSFSNHSSISSINLPESTYCEYRGLPKLCWQSEEEEEEDVENNTKENNNREKEEEENNQSKPEQESKQKSKDSFTIVPATEDTSDPPSHNCVLS
jgi:hypothetical protein